MPITTLQEDIQFTIMLCMTPQITPDKLCDAASLPS